MKRILLLPALGMVLLSSCATAFKSGQTPDDVYFSPGNEAGAIREEQVKKEEEVQYQEYVSSLDDRYLRMKVANRYRWGTIDNFDYWYDSRYDFGSYSYNPYTSYNYYNRLNPYASWNPFWSTGFSYGYRGGWNNPYATVIYYTNPYYGKSSGGSTSGSNISAYRNKSYDNTNYGYKDPKTGVIVPGGSSNSSFGNLLKRVFSSSETTSSYDRPARTFDNTPGRSNTPTPSSTPAPATSSSAGGSSGGYGSTGSSTSTGRGGRGG